MSHIVKLYTTASRKIMVSYTDPTRRDSSGQKKRVVKWFAAARRKEAEEYRGELERRLLQEGAAAVANQTQIRHDAYEARGLLDNAGFKALSLREAAAQWVMQWAHGHRHATLPSGRDGDKGAQMLGGKENKPIAFGQAVATFLEHMQRVAEARPRTVANLRARLGLWERVAGLRWVSDINRSAVLALRDRSARVNAKGQDRAQDVSRQTRVNDLLAASAFCSWLVEREWLAFNPVSGVKRPDAARDRPRPRVWSVDELARLLQAARGYEGGRFLLALVAMNFIGGARPSEVAGLRIRYEHGTTGKGVSGIARIEGGKMGGRADRNVALLPVALAWLGKMGWPEQGEALTGRARQEICKEAGGLKWVPDICRHTCISHLVALKNNDAAVARECGTSEEVIFSRYHNLCSPEELEEWMGLRPEGQVEAKQLVFPM